MKKKISLFVLCGIVLLGVCGCGSNSIVGNTYEQEIKDDKVNTYSSYYFKDDNNVEIKIVITYNDKELSNKTETSTYSIDDDIITINDKYNTSFKINGSCLIDNTNEKVKYCK